MRSSLRGRSSFGFAQLPFPASLSYLFRFGPVAHFDIAQLCIFGFVHSLKNSLEKHLMVWCGLSGVEAHLLEAHNIDILCDYSF